MTQDELDALPEAWMLDLFLTRLAHITDVHGQRWILGWYNGVRYKSHPWFWR